MILEALGFKSPGVKSVAVMPRLSEGTVPTQDNVPMTEIDEEICIANTTTQWVQQPLAPRNVSATWEQGQPRLTSSMNQEYFNRSHLPKGYELQKQQKFGKDTLYQLFNCDKSLLHNILHLYKSKFLVKTDLKKLWIRIPITRHLWQDWKCTKHLPFWKLS
jgi:hypothetical protein